MADVRDVADLHLRAMTAPQATSGFNYGAQYGAGYAPQQSVPQQNGAQQGFGAQQLPNQFNGGSTNANGGFNSSESFRPNTGVQTQGSFYRGSQPQNPTNTPPLST